MRNPTVVTHTPPAITMMNFFMFQIAMLVEPMSKVLLRKGTGISRNSEDNVHAEQDQEVSGSKR